MSISLRSNWVKGMKWPAMFGFLWQSPLGMSQWAGGKASTSVIGLFSTRGVLVNKFNYILCIFVNLTKFQFSLPQFSLPQINCGQIIKKNPFLPEKTKAVSATHNLVAKELPLKGVCCLDS